MKNNFEDVLKVVISAAYLLPAVIVTTKKLWHKRSMAAITAYWLFNFFVRLYAYLFSHGYLNTPLEKAMALVTASNLIDFALMCWIIYLTAYPVNLKKISYASGFVIGLASLPFYFVAASSMQANVVGNTVLSCLAVALQSWQVYTAFHANKITPTQTAELYINVSLAFNYAAFIPICIFVGLYKALHKDSLDNEVRILQLCGSAISVAITIVTLYNFEPNNDLEAYEFSDI